MKETIKAGKPGGTVTTPGDKGTAGKPGGVITTPGSKGPSGKPGGTMSWEPRDGGGTSPEKYG